MISFTEASGQEYSLEDLLGEGGMVARSNPAFEVRQEQLQMAAKVQEALRGEHHLAVEAGTGVGKSFAYLVPVIEAVSSGAGRAVISTHTINLQEQLINKDLPFLASKLPFSFQAALAKGRGNFVCLRRLEYAVERHKGLFDQFGSQVNEIAAWAKRSEDGSLSDLGFTPSSDVWDAVRSEHGNCQGRKCGRFSKCFYWKGRRRLERADIVVANHALLFSDLVLKRNGPMGVLPDYKFAVIDEAHNAEAVAEEHFGINISNYSFSWLLNRLYNPRTKRGLLNFAGGGEAVMLVKKCLEAVKVFFRQVQAWSENSDIDNNGLCRAGFVEDNISEIFKQLRGDLNRRAKNIENEDDKYELTHQAMRMGELVSQVGEIVSGQKEDFVYWVEAGGGKRKRVALRSAPVKVADYVKECLFDLYPAVILTSATLSCGSGSGDSGFGFFAERIGLTDYESLKLGSPFDYENNVTMYVESRMPNPNEPAFHDMAVEVVKKYLLMSEGRAFVLFTSYSMLRKMAEEMGDWLVENDMQLLQQGSGVDRSSLLREFKSDTRSVLFGTDSFWQGVDVPGEALSNVIIVKLPFAVPNHPLIAGKIERIRAEGRNPFFEYQLPSAIIKFKQGFGRLVRNKTDKGIVAVLDSRIVTKRYGRAFIEAVPRCRTVVVKD